MRQAGGRSGCIGGVTSAPARRNYYHPPALFLKTRLRSMEDKISKFDLAILASVFVGLFWIEHGHRVHIGIEGEQAAISSSANLGMSGVPID